MNKNARLTPLQAIRNNCIECSGGSLKEVRLCEMDDCPLHFYRLGNNPRRKGVGNKKASQNLAKQKDELS